MSIPTTIESLSTIAASNGPSGSDQRTLADDGLRQGFAFIKQLKSLATLASASTITPPSTANTFSITGTTTINTIASTNSWDGRDVWFIFAGALTLTHSSNLALPGSANITTAANDAAVFIQTAPGAWRCTNYLRATGALLSNSGSSLTLTGDLSVQGNTTLGNSGTDTLTTNGNVTINAPSSGDSVAITQIAGGRGVYVVGSLSGADAQSKVENTSNTASSNARFILTVAGGSAGDPYWVAEINGGTSWGFGGDNSDSDTFKIDAGAALTTATNRFNVTSDGRWYGNALHNNAGAVTGTTNQYIASGTYTPTLTNVANVSTLTSGACQWIRVGNVVSVSGTHTIASTVGGSVCQFRQSLPIASNLVAISNLGGSLATHNGFEFGPIIGDVTNDAGFFEWQTTNTASFSMGFQFMYTVL